MRDKQAHQDLGARSKLSRPHQHPGYLDDLNTHEPHPYPQHLTSRTPSSCIAHPINQISPYSFTPSAFASQTCIGVGCGGGSPTKGSGVARSHTDRISKQAASAAAAITALPMAESRRSSSNSPGDQGATRSNSDAALPDAHADAPAELQQPADSPPAAGANDGGSQKSTVDAQGRALNPRSCVTCRKRKVKCDKIHPCTNCKRAKIECIYPAPGRAPRKVRKVGEGRDKELLERLRRLEGVVKNLGVDVPDGQEPKDANKEEDSKAKVADTGRRAVSGDAASSIPKENGAPPQGELKRRWTASHTDEAGPEPKSRWADESAKGRLEHRFGRLVVNEGRSRYINNSFWANLSNEVEDLKGILNQSSDDDDPDTPNENGQVSSSHHGFIFGFSSQNVDMLSLHPVSQQIGAYWLAFKENVDPLVKILHIPTFERTIEAAASNLANLPRGLEALMFTIYYGAVTSLSDEDCLTQFGEAKTVLLARYRFAIEQALARANFLITEEIIVLQALVLFLMCLRRNSYARVIWTLTGLVVRIAQTIGVHRDGVHFGLKPFDVEMRRRLWWQVCILDTRASEDHGCDPTITEQSFDTKMPLNINDVDISLDAKDFPPEKQGCTDMSFCLIRFEVSNTFRRINYIPPGPPKACTEHLAGITLQEKEKWITECHQRLEERYLKNCDMTVPLFWVTATVARLMMSKMWLMVYHPFQRQDGGTSLSTETKDKLFITSLENIEYSILLETEARTMKWGWLFKTYMQWHALAFILSELCHRTTGDLIERAWTAVESTRDGRWGERMSENDSRGQLWRPLKKLYNKAKDARRRGLQEEQLLKHRVSGAAPTRTYSPNANPMFGHPKLPTMVRAPLSQAQLQRFTQGPVYGQRPIDSHELLKSPRLPLAGGVEIDPMDIVQPDALASIPEEGRHHTPRGSISSTSNFAQRNGQPVRPQAQQPSGLSNARTEFGEAFNRPIPSVDYTTIDLTHPCGSNGTPGNGNVVFSANQNNNFPNHAAGPSNSTRVSSIDSNFDPSMDTTGDLDWENWDQLVRQFGMDVDLPKCEQGLDGNNWDSFGGLPPGNGQTPATGQQNYRMGSGVGGGDWF